MSENLISAASWPGRSLLERGGAPGRGAGSGTARRDSPGEPAGALPEGAPSAAPRALNRPHPVNVRVAAGGTPRVVGGQVIEAVRESWLVEDRWWTDRPLRRRYWELVGVKGRNVVVFHDLTPPGGRGAPGGWFTQAA